MESVQLTINYLGFYLEKPEKEGQFKPKLSKRKNYKDKSRNQCNRKWTKQ